MDNNVIDISSLDFENLDDTPSLGGSRSNFGMDLLMNDSKKKSSFSGSNIDLEELTNLEDEMNNLVAETSVPKFDSGLFDSDKPSVRFDDDLNLDLGIGKSTADTESDTKTWDGYGKFNNIPVNPDKHISSQPQLSKEAMLREKFKYLRKLEGLEKDGIQLTKKYSMDSNLQEMQGEYEMIMEEREKKAAINFQGQALLLCVQGIEFLNGKFDPFDIKLDGWGMQVQENISSYDSVFEELYDKYKSKVSMAPELKLLFQLGGSAMMAHIGNTIIKNSLPSMDDILKQNPDLMRQFQSAAVNSMSESSPGFSNFMSNIANAEPQVPRGRGPPPPMNPQMAPPPQGRAGNNSFARPDLNAARQQQPQPTFDDGINIRENFETASRPEMKGPSDLSELMSGLKTKTKVINIQESAPNNDSSNISLNDLKELQLDANMPKRSKRKPRSDKNTVSLDM
jgi:Family of unknown function (DUF5767)